MAVVFSKTEKGQAEIAQRTLRLHPRERRVLILVDGKRTVQQLRELALADDLTHTLGQLEEAGLIEPTEVQNQRGEGRAVSGALPSITEMRELPVAESEKELEMARQFMLNTLRMFCGQYGKMSLMTAVAGATTHQALRDQFAEWYRAIVDTRDGRRRAEELREQLLKLI